MGCGSSSPAAVEEPGKGALAPDTQPPCVWRLCVAPQPPLDSRPTVDGLPHARSSEPRTDKFASSYRLGAKLGAGGACGQTAWNGARVQAACSHSLLLSHVPTRPPPGFATVRVAVSVGSEVSHAVKIMPMPREGAAPAGDGATRAEIFNEVAILAKVQHPNCLRYKVCGLWPTGLCVCSRRLACAWWGQSLVGGRLRASLC